MSSRCRSELPDDLERLGHHLETAVARAVRRHSRRQAIMGFVGAVFIAVPFALAGTEADLAPGVGPLPRRTTAPAPAASESFADGFMVRRVDTGWVAARPSLPCLVTRDCRAPHEPVASAWLGRY